MGFSAMLIWDFVILSERETNILENTLYLRGCINIICSFCQSTQVKSPASNVSVHLISEPNGCKSLSPSNADFSPALIAARR